MLPGYFIACSHRGFVTFFSSCTVSIRWNPNNSISPVLPQALALTKFYCTHWPVVAYEAVRKGLDDGSLVVIDVREPTELKEDGKIPNAHNIPLGDVASAFTLNKTEFKSRYGFEKPDYDAENLVTSCRSGKRATAAAEMLKKQGYEHIKVYQGSFLDWVEKGGTIEKDG